MINTKKHNFFNVHNYKDNYTFLHMQIDNSEAFIEVFCEYLLNEENLLRYIENKTSLVFEPTKMNYTLLYKNIDKFIDDENIVALENISQNLIEVIVDEFETIDDSEYIKIRLDKIGRMGEYIFHLLLSEYFQIECIIPKTHLTTNKNMSVYGIDLLFMDKTKKILFFGESKMSKSLKNGMQLINESLKDYEEQIKNEFKLILSNRHILKNNLNDTFNCIDVCLDFEEFIQEAKIDKIGIPIFIAHGTEKEKEDILEKLEKNISRKTILGLKTIYIAISLPLLNKQRFSEYLTICIKNKLIEYQEKRKNG